MGLGQKIKTIQAAIRSQALEVSVEASLSRSNARKQITKRRFTWGNLSLMPSKMRRAIVTEQSAGRNMFCGANKPAIGRDKPPPMCHSRLGTSFVFREPLFPKMVECTMTLNIGKVLTFLTR